MYLSSFMSPADPDSALGGGSTHMAFGSWESGGGGGGGWSSEHHSCPKSVGRTFSNVYMVLMKKKKTKNTQILTGCLIHHFVDLYFSI